MRLDKTLRFAAVCSGKQAEARWGWLFALPWLLGLFVFYLYPLISSFYYSFTSYSILQEGGWIGAGHYRMLLHDGYFQRAVANSLVFAALFVPLSLAASLGLAVLLQYGGKAVRAYRAIFFVPTLVPLTAKAMIWLSLLNPELGPLHRLLSGIGVNAPAWLQSESWSKPALALLSLWGIGQLMLIAAAGLQRIPQAYYAAAAIDGAGALRSFTAITLPLLRPVLIYQLITGMIGALQLFTLPYALTAGQGTPGGSLMFYVMYVHQHAFLYLRMGYASAMSWCLFAVTLLLTALLAAFVRKRLHE
jgi:multiple sugar transport system permease protein